MINETQQLEQILWMLLNMQKSANGLYMPLLFFPTCVQFLL